MIGSAYLVHVPGVGGRECWDAEQGRRAMATFSVRLSPAETYRFVRYHAAYWQTLGDAAAYAQRLESTLGLLSCDGVQLAVLNETGIVASCRRPPGPRPRMFVSGAALVLSSRLGIVSVCLGGQAAFVRVRRVPAGATPVRRWTPTLHRLAFATQAFLAFTSVSATEVVGL